MNSQDPKQNTIEQIEKLKNVLRQLNKPNSTIFAPPMTLPEIVKFEVVKHIRITDDFREWLKFSAGCSIENGAYQIFFPYTVNEFDRFVSSEEAAVGGIRNLNIVFAVSKTTGRFSKYENGVRSSLNSFGEIIDLVSQYIMENNGITSGKNNSANAVRNNTPHSDANVVNRTEGVMNFHNSEVSHPTPNFVLQNGSNPYELDEKIRKISELSKQFTQSFPSYFDVPANDSEIDMIERANRITIPLSYKKWLKNFRCCAIFGDTFRFFLPESSGYYNSVVPREYLVIGEMVGDGERICISKKTGRIAAVYHDVITEYEDFETVIDAVLKIFEDFSDSESYSNIIDPQSDRIKMMSDRELYDYIMSPKPEKYREAQNIWNMYLVNDDQRRERFISFLNSNRQFDRKKMFRNNYFEEVMFMLRVCAVKDFWNNERELICHGKGTVNWKPEQQIRILNKNSMTGMLSRNAVPGIVLDDRGNPVVNMCGMNILYDAHQMYDVYHYPKYAAVSQNIQALTPCDHIIGAHRIRYI